MLKALLLTTILTATAGAAAAQDKTINFNSWGGAYSAAQLKAYVQPFETATGIRVNMVDSDNPATPVKAEVEAGNVTTDVATVDMADAVRLCDEGDLEDIDPASLKPGADGSAATDDFLPDTLNDCFVASDIYATVAAYDTTRFEGHEPTKLADFFDLQAFPGKRGLHKSAKATLEMALMADGVPAAEVYDVLNTPEGVDRAFAKLDTIKSSVVWWDAGAQPPQLLADGEVAMTTAYNGRIFDAMVQAKKPFAIIWDGQVYEVEGFIIPKGAPNKELAAQFVAFASSPESLAESTRFISYGPPRKSSAPLVTTYADGTTEMTPNLPTTEANLKTALASSNEFWADHDSQLSERFSSWLAK